MPNFPDITNQRFGRLVAIRILRRDRTGIHWLCACDCGQQSVTTASHLRRGHTRSCGCFRIDVVVNRSLRHGHSRPGAHSPTHQSWRAMQTRCDNPRGKCYELYGGRGIAVCDRWRVFENFLADMGERPEGLTLDRLDVEGNYEPGNCRWATVQEQNRNRRRRRAA